MKQTCLGKNESQSMVDRIRERLVDITNLLEAKEPQTTFSFEAFQEHMQSLNRMHAFLTQQANDHEAESKVLSDTDAHTKIFNCTKCGFDLATNCVFVVNVGKKLIILKQKMINLVKNDS